MVTRTVFFFVIFMLLCFSNPISAGENDPFVIEITIEGGLLLYCLGEEAFVTVYDADSEVVWIGWVTAGNDQAVKLPSGTYHLVEADGVAFGAKEVLKRSAAASASPTPAGGSRAYAHPSPDGKVHVLCVPRPFYFNYYDRHYTYPNHEVTLKAVIWPVEGVTYDYRWEYLYQGNPVVINEGVFLPGDDQYVLEAQHVFPPGAPIYTSTFDVTLTLHGDDGDGPATNPNAVGYYRLRMMPADDIPTTRRIIAVEDGLWYLHKQMFGRQDLNHAEPVWIGKFSSNLGIHAQCVAAFFAIGFLPSNKPADYDPYVETVQRALNYILSQLTIVDISSEPLADTDGDGVGLIFESSDNMYENGLGMAALARAQAFHDIVPTVKSLGHSAAPYINGLPYGEVLQDYADMIYFAQKNDGGNYNGGWRYTPNYADSDWSVTQWPVLAVFLTQHLGFNATPQVLLDVPNHVIDDLMDWVHYVQHPTQGYFTYQGKSSNIPNVGLTGAGMVALDWLQYNGIDSIHGQATSERIENARNWIGSHWGDTGQYGNIGSYYNMDAVMKAASLHGVGDIFIDPISFFPGTHNHYWTYDPDYPNDGYWPFLIDNQQTSGKWPDVYWGSSYHPIDTAWAVGMLSGSVGPLPPMVVLMVNGLDPQQSEIVTDKDAEVAFDGSESYDLNEPPMKITKYIFEFGDGTGPYTEEEGNAPDGKFDGQTTHVYTDYSGTPPDHKPGFPASLVVENEAGQKSQAYYAEIIVRPSNHPPTPVWYWYPVPVFVGQTTTFDASMSYDIDEPFGDAITEYAWDFDGDGEWDKYGPIVTWTYYTDGMKLVTLRLTDTPGLWPNSPWPVIDQATVFVNPIPDSSTVFFSPRTYMTLGLYPNIFGVYDADLAVVDVFYQYLGFLFDGTPYNIKAIDAVDLVVDPQTLNTHILFSIREDRMLCDGNGFPFFLKRNEVAMLDTATGVLTKIFTGPHNMKSVDALVILDDGKLIFSPSEDFYHFGNPGLYVMEEDLVLYDPGDNGDLSIYLRGSQIGISTLDGADVGLSVEQQPLVYFSVRNPIFIYKPPFDSVYLKDGDVGVFNMETGEVQLFMEGNAFHVSTLDALAVEDTSIGGEGN